MYDVYYYIVHHYFFMIIVLLLSDGEINCISEHARNLKTFLAKSWESVFGKVNFCENSFRMKNGRVGNPLRMNKRREQKRNNRPPPPLHRFLLLLLLDVLACSSSLPLSLQLVSAAVNARLPGSRLLVGHERKGRNTRSPGEATKPRAALYEARGAIAGMLRSLVVISCPYLPRITQ